LLTSVEMPRTQHKNTSCDDHSGAKGGGLHGGRYYVPGDSPASGRSGRQVYDWRVSPTPGTLSVAMLVLIAILAFMTGSLGLLGSAVTPQTVTGVMGATATWASLPLSHVTVSHHMILPPGSPLNLTGNMSSTSSWSHESTSGGAGARAQALPELYLSSSCALTGRKSRLFQNTGKSSCKSTARRFR